MSRTLTHFRQYILKTSKPAVKSQITNILRDKDIKKIVETKTDFNPESARRFRQSMQLPCKTFLSAPQNKVLLLTFAE
jgi:hypothetical protein